MPQVTPVRLIGLAGKAGAGKDTFYEQVLKPRGYLRWPMSLHYKVWLAATHRYDWDDLFYQKPPRVRQVLQEEITALRSEYGEEIWFNTFSSWMRALHEIVGVHAPGIAITDLRFLIEIIGVKRMGGKIIHLQAVDEQANVAPELRGHRSETELDRPEIAELRDAYVLNLKHSVDQLRERGEQVLQEWGWGS
jgi:hypothetical protein